MTGSEQESAATYRLTGGGRIPDETYEKLVRHYQLEKRGGHLVFIEAHKRTTAQMVVSRYSKNSDTTADIWNGSQVAVWTTSVEVIDDIAATIPDRDVVDEVRTHGDRDE